MSPKVAAALSTLLILLVIGGFAFWGDMIQTSEDGEQFIHIQVKEKDAVVEKPERTPIDELNELASEVSSKMRAESRLNLNMMAQLRAYREMLQQIQQYADKTERDIDTIKEINRNEFQEDVILQASLFSGKKPEMVASHLEEFRASRVGAILAKMKEREASTVLDIWAKNKDHRISNFYRQVMKAYLKNKRRDANPELFNKLNPTEQAS